jgi:hypothetical protein
LLLVASTVGIVGIGGCSGSPGDGPTLTTDGHEEELPEGVSAETFEHGSVPETYRQATS